MPIPSGGSIQVQRNVISMNTLFYDLCSLHRLYFIDAFRLFVDNSGRRILSLFPNGNTKDRVIDIHPNSWGMGVMAKKIILLIHSRWFNPLGYSQTSIIRASIIRGPSSSVVSEDKI